MFLLVVMIDVLISFLRNFFSRSCLAYHWALSTAKQSKAPGRSRSLLGDASFSLRPSSDKVRERNKTAKLFPCCKPPYSEDSLQLALAFLSVHLLHSLLLAQHCRYRSLTPENPPNFRKKEGRKQDIILNPLYIYQKLFPFFSFSVSHCC